MKNFVHLLVGIVALALSTTVIAYSAPTDSLFLNVVVPETDTTLAAPTQRISACTLPGAHAFINGLETKVYPSGAFCGAASIPVDTSVLKIVVRDSTGDSLSHDFVMIRQRPPITTPHDPASIDSIMMEPSQDLWLGTGDVLEVRFKGSTGYEATFDIPDVESGIPMTELPPAMAHGLSGVYVGRYHVHGNEEAKDVRIRFKLHSGFWGSEKACSRGIVSIIPHELPRVAEVRGRRPYLNAGLGADRLGGAKLGFLQGGVRLVVTGKVGNQYRVRLGDEMEAWLPQFFAELLPPDAPLPSSLVGSLTVTGKGDSDIVTVALRQRLPWLSEQRLDPSRLMVTVYGATSNTNWITQQLSATEISGVTWTQIAEDEYQLTIALRHEQQWGYDVGYDNGSTLRIVVRHPPAIRKDSLLAGLTIAVDAGHGGESDGALGTTGVKEKFMTLDIAQRLDTVLMARGVRVVMTRNSDTDVSMSQRTDSILATGAQILVSVHCNSIGETTDPALTKGVSTYYRYIGYQSLANILYGKMLELGLDEQGVTGSFNFSLNAPTQLPNALVECAFMSNPEDEILLLDPAFRQRIAEHIAKGVEEFVGKYGLVRQ